MKTLLVLRHAKSSWKDASQSDHDRPLNNRGLQTAPRMGRLMANRRLIPDLVLSSTARRAQDTATLVTEACGYEDVVETQPELYLATPAEWLAVLRGVSTRSERVLVVGHNPGLEELVMLLGGEHQHMPTATLAHLELPVESWTELEELPRGRVVDVWRPRELDEAD